MRKKLIKHFFITLCFALITVAFVNIGIVYFESRQFFTHSDEYLFGRHYVNQLVSDFAKHVTQNSNGGIEITDAGLKLLDNVGMNVQILNNDNYVVYQVGTSQQMKAHYSNVELFNLFQTLEDETVFVNEIELDGQLYTYLLFFPSNVVKRFVFHYNTQEIMTMHNIPLLIMVNIFLILVISLIYARYLSRPLNAIIQRILALSKGEYVREKYQSSLYAEVEESIDELASKLEEADVQRQKVEKLREEWIGNITHDIKTPLTSIRGNAEILEDEEYEIDLVMRQQYAAVILQQSDYIKTLVDDLNLSTRLKNGNISLKQVKINIVSLLREVVIDFLNNPKYEGYEIQFTYQEEYIPLMLDELLMKRVFINLMINAMVHNKAGTVIKVEIEQKQGTIIRISDNGVGVSEEELAHIFKRYYRGTDTTKASEGSGLGLAIAYDIVKIHGAQMKGEVPEGKGLEITIQFT